MLFTHTHTKQVTDALGSTLSKTREGGDLVFFFCCNSTKALGSAFPGLPVCFARKEERCPKPAGGGEGGRGQAAGPQAAWLSR